MTPSLSAKAFVQPLFIFGRRSFASTCRCDGPSFFDLGARAASRESYHISKQSGIPHIDSAPSLQLLRAERDLAENRKNDRSAQVAKQKQPIPLEQNPDAYDVFITKKQAFAPSQVAPDASASDSRVLDEQIMYLRRTIEQYKNRIVKLEQEYSERSENTFRRESIWKYVGTALVALTIVGMSQSYRWRQRYFALDNELDETRREMGAVKRERDHLNTVWYEKMRSETTAKVAEKVMQEERRERTVGGGLSSLLWK